MYKIEQFTEGQIDLIKALATGCNICLYRQGLVRLRDKDHNPLRNIRSDMFEKIKDYCVKKDGLFVFDESQRKLFPTSILI